MRQALETQFSLDLTERKEWIKIEVQKAIDALDAPAEDDAEEGEEQDSDDADEDSAPGKKRKAASGGGGGGGGFRQPQHLSPLLAQFMGKPSAARTEVVSHICAYVKSKQLQNEANRREILCDSTLSALLGVPSCTYFSLQKFLQPHFLGKDENAELVGSASPKLSSC